MRERAFQARKTTEQVSKSGRERNEERTVSTSVWLKYRVLEEKVNVRGRLEQTREDLRPSSLKYLETHHKKIIQNLHIPKLIDRFNTTPIKI